MKVLIVGGTKFLGRHLTVAALAKQHEVTLFNRGKLQSDDIPKVERIYGDRNSDLDKLKNRSWDAVIDTCGYLPQTVAASVEALKNSVSIYVFVSSISVYADFSQPNFDESAPLAVLTEEQKQQFQRIDPKDEINASALGNMYGALKVLCEKEAKKVLPEKVLCVRSGLIVGSYDWTDRFTYWVMRIADGGEVLAPGSPNRFVQLIDARDLSEWIIEMVGRGEIGTYNVTGERDKLTMANMLNEMKDVSQSNAFFTFVSDEFLHREKVQNWSEMPLFLSESDLSLKGFLSANIDKAVECGLKFRPLKDTVQHVLTWRKANIETHNLKAGLTVERERELLQKWHKINKSNI